MCLFFIDLLLQSCTWYRYIYIYKIKNPVKNGRTYQLVQDLSHQKGDKLTKVHPLPSTVLLHGPTPQHTMASCYADLHRSSWLRCPSLKRAKIYRNWLTSWIAWTSPQRSGRPWDANIYIYIHTYKSTQLGWLDVFCALEIEHSAYIAWFCVANHFNALVLSFRTYP